MLKMEFLEKLKGSNGRKKYNKEFPELRKKLLSLQTETKPMLR